MEHHNLTIMLWCVQLVWADIPVYWKWIFPIRFIPIVWWKMPSYFNSSLLGFHWYFMLAMMIYFLGVNFVFESNTCIKTHNYWLIQKVIVLLLLYGLIYKSNTHVYRKNIQVFAYNLNNIYILKKILFTIQFC